MPSPEQCAAKFKPGSKQYKDCVAYKGAYANKGKANPVKGSLQKPKKAPAGGGGY
tara:strand:+ start:34 stop:198 length:165 start_codon:yes stop_codon:yes gene_type:complete